MKPKEQTYILNQEQLVAAVAGLDAVIDDTKGLIESLEDPHDPRNLPTLSPAEQKQLVSEKQRLRNFCDRRKELVGMMKHHAPKRRQRIPERRRPHEENQKIQADNYLAPTTDPSP